MAVYTEVSDEELEVFVAQYDIGEIESCIGIAEGVENSNFLLQTSQDRFILTLYEKRVNPEELPFFIGLMEHLATRGVSCPKPIRGRDGEALRPLCGKPASLTTFLQGVWPRRVQVSHCSQLGHSMAEMHLAGQDFTMRRANNMGPAAWRPLFELAKKDADQVKPGLAEWIERELCWLEGNWPDDLPGGVIHADLFPDNVFFQGGRFSGFIDFYFACTDFLVYDLAIVLNAWCFEPDNSFNITKARAMLACYQKIRPLSRQEYDALPVLARGSALRFLLTRLYDWLNTPADALVKRKDPLEYEKKLRFHAQVSGASAYGLDPFGGS